MPHWLIKAALQRVLSFLPNSHKWNELFQKHVTRSIEVTADRFEGRLDFCNRHFEDFAAVRPGSKSFTVLELGTGWYPVVPIGLYLCGAAETWTYDIAPLLSEERVRRTLSLFEEYDRSGNLEQRLPHLWPDRLATVYELARSSEGLPPEKLLERMKIHVCVQDAQRTGLRPGTIDLMVSTGVLQHIPRDVLVNILKEFQRIGTRESVMSHYLNLADQYSYFDRNITPFNFLRFSNERWKWFNSPITWLNRMRISDYRELFAETGFQVIKEINVSGSVEDLKSIPLAPEFQKYKLEDLLVLRSWIGAKSNNGVPVTQIDPIKSERLLSEKATELRCVCSPSHFSLRPSHLVLS